MRRSDIKPLPTQAELQRLFSYDPETGRLTWRIRPTPQASHATPGQAAGTITNKGYVHIGVGAKGKTIYYLAHRLVWKMMTGTDPVDQVDHIDGNRLNNQWANLRACGNRENKWNGKLYRNNKSGFKGVFFRPGQPFRPWIARLKLKDHHKYKHLGAFETPEAAASAWREAAASLHGEFFRS